MALLSLVLWEKKKGVTELRPTSYLCSYPISIHGYFYIYLLTTYVPVGCWLATIYNYLVRTYVDIWRRWPSRDLGAQQVATISATCPDGEGRGRDRVEMKEICSLARGQGCCSRAMVNYSFVISVLQMFKMIAICGHYLSTYVPK